LDVGSRFAVEPARRLYHLPYFHARMSMQPRGDWIEVESVRAATADRPVVFSGRYRPRGPVFAAAPGSLEHFLAERYCLYAVNGLATGSLGLISEAVHSGTDLVAALLTFFAIGVAARPADRGHAYGHGKADHLAALAEGAFLVAASLFISWRAILRLTGSTSAHVHATGWAMLVLGVVIALDASRATVSWRAAIRYRSAALQSNALHFASDLGGSVTVLVGLVLVRAGYRDADSIAALAVAALVLLAAGRLMRRNVDVLMDRAPAEAEAAARSAIGELEPGLELRRLRMRQAAGRHFADVVIGVSPGAAVGQGHAAADAGRAAVQRALPESDVVVHVEPRGDEPAIQERALAAATRVGGVREIHNLSVLTVDGRMQVSLHL